MGFDPLSIPDMQNNREENIQEVEIVQGIKHLWRVSFDIVRSKSYSTINSWCLKSTLLYDITASMTTTTTGSWLFFSRMSHPTQSVFKICKDECVIHFYSLKSDTLDWVFNAVDVSSCRHLDVVHYSSEKQTVIPLQASLLFVLFQVIREKQNKTKNSLSCSRETEKSDITEHVPQ